MNDRELLQEALDAMEENWRSDKSDLAIEALRARLSQPEPKPVAWGLQQQFEGKIGTAPVAFKRHDEFGFVVPLYTAPPPREWVGLTDEEKHSAIWTGGEFGDGVLLAEKLLKERNT